MRFPSALLLAIFLGSNALLAAQTPANQTPAIQVPAAQAAPNTAPSTAPAAPAPSETLRSALDVLQQAVSTVRVDKWKAPGTVREQTEANINSIQRDLQSTLPALLTDADAAPNSVAHLLPVLNNVGALYDVLLRVASVGNLAAPGQQSDQLDQAIASLDVARRSFNDRLQSNATAQEQQVSDLKAALRAKPPAPQPVAVACPTPPPPAKKRKPRPKPATTSPTTSTNTPASNSTSH